MPRISPHRSRQSYRHEAYLWHDACGYTAGLGSFIRDGLEADEPVMVAVVAEHLGWLRDDLGPLASEVEFVDMGQLGRNPARIIPAWQDFLDRKAKDRHPARGIGEPIWPGRRPEELLECQLHEALLNVAVEPEIPFWLICPYDSERLTPAVMHEAQRSHPVIVEADSYQGSPHYGGRAHVDSLFGGVLPQPGSTPIRATFDPHDVNRLPTYVKLEAYVAGLSVPRAQDLAAATERLALSSLHRGALHGSVRIWRQPGAVVCEVSDDTVVDDLLIGRRVPFGDDHDGLWLANQLCDLVQLRSTPTGTVVRAYAWLEPGSRDH